MAKLFRLIALLLLAIGGASLIVLRIVNPVLYKTVALKLFAYSATAFLAVLGLVVGVTLLISAVLILVMLLQLVGLVKRIPLGYNVRNLMVRWRITVLTGLAFILVVGLTTVLLAFVNGMYALTKGSAVPGNVMILADGATDEVFSDLGYGDIGNLPSYFSRSIKTMTIQSGGKEITTPMFSWELYQVVNQPIPNAKPGGRQRRFVQLRRRGTGGLGRSPRLATV